MKSIKYILSLGVIFMLTGSVSYAFNEPSYSSYIVKRASGGRLDDPTRVVRLVRFSSQSPNGPDIASGDAVVWNTLSDDGVTVQLTTTSSDGSFAGIATGAIQTSDRSASIPPTSAFDDIGRRNWGYIVVNGFANAKITAGSGGSDVAGKMFVTSTDSGGIVGVGTPAAGSIADGLGVTTAINEVQAKGGFFYDSPSASDASVEVYVKAE